MAGGTKVFYRQYVCECELYAYGVSSMTLMMPSLSELYLVLEFFSSSGTRSNNARSTACKNSITYILATGSNFRHKIESRTALCYHILKLQLILKILWPLTDNSIAWGQRSHKWTENDSACYNNEPSHIVDTWKDPSQICRKSENPDCPSGAKNVPHKMRKRHSGLSAAGSSVECTHSNVSTL